MAFVTSWELWKYAISDYSQVSNRKGGQNKQGGWQILAKIINWVQ